MTTYKVLPSQAKLKRLFTYLPTTGELVNRTTRNPRAKKGVEAGNVCGGYREVQINLVGYQTHRVIWKWVTGEDPKDKEVDHKDHDGFNNAWDNLRLCSHHENCMNSSLQNNNTSTHSNISSYLSKTKGRRWEVQMSSKLRRGWKFKTYNTLEEAIAARDKAYEEVGFHNNHRCKTT